MLNKILVFSFAWIVLAGFGAAAASAETYLSGNMGLSSVSDADIRADQDGGELSLDHGFAVTGALGQTVGGAGRVEIELGYRTNDIDRVELDSFGTIAEDGDIRTVSLMGNAYYDLATGTSFTPFIGGGVGLANIEADIKAVGSDDDTLFAYQVAAGGSLALDDRLTIDLQYRYFATADPAFDGVDAEYETHNLMFGLRLSF